jgi:pyruvate-ferredoxin/flavodoxin oxidoreductase
VKSGYWPLYRYRPGTDEHTHPFQLDSADPTVALVDFVSKEGRYAMLQRSDPDRAADLMELAQADVDERWRYYRQLAGIERSMPHLAEHLDDETADADDTTDGAGNGKGAGA